MVSSNRGVRIQWWFMSARGCDVIQKKNVLNIIELVRKEPQSAFF